MILRRALSLIIGVLIVVALTIPVEADPSHNDEIQAYAGLAAMAQIVSDRCADILVNNERLQSAPTFFHMTPDDEQNARFAYDIEMKRLAAAIDAAPSLQAWCDAAYRGYGPTGDIVKGLFAR